MGVSLRIPDPVIQGLGLPEGEIAHRLRTEQAIALYCQGVLPRARAETRRAGWDSG